MMHASIYNSLLVAESQCLRHFNNVVDSGMAEYSPIASSLVGHVILVVKLADTGYDIVAPSTELLQSPQTHLPELGSNLVTTLSGLDMNDLSHVSGCC